MCNSAWASGQHGIDRPNSNAKFIDGIESPPGSISWQIDLRVVQVLLVLWGHKSVHTVRLWGPVFLMETKSPHNIHFSIFRWIHVWRGSALMSCRKCTIWESTIVNFKNVQTERSPKCVWRKPERRSLSLISLSQWEKKILLQWNPQSSCERLIQHLQSEPAFHFNKWSIDLQCMCLWQHELRFTVSCLKVS